MNSEVLRRLASVLLVLMLMAIISEAPEHSWWAWTGLAAWLVAFSANYIKQFVIPKENISDEEDGEMSWTRRDWQIVITYSAAAFGSGLIGHVVTACYFHLSWLSWKCFGGGVATFVFGIVCLYLTYALVNLAAKPAAAPKARRAAA